MGGHALFYGPQFTEVFGGLDPDNPYVDDKPNYEKDTTSGKYIIVNDWKNSVQNTDDSAESLPSQDVEHGAYRKLHAVHRAVKIYRQTGIQPQTKSCSRPLQNLGSDYAVGRVDNDGYQEVS